MMTPPGGMEWVIVLVIVLVLFGGARLPRLARSLGQSIAELRRASAELETGDAGLPTEDLRE